MHRREIVKSEIGYDNEMCVCLQFSYQTFSKLAGVPYLSGSLNARNKTQSYIDSYKRTGQSYRTGQNIFTGVPFGNRVPGRRWLVFTNYRNCWYNLNKSTR